MGPRYWLLLSAYLTSAIGNWIYRLTLPLLVLHLTGSALGMGLLYAIEYLPYLLLSMFGGVLADRFDRKRILVAGDLAAAAIAGVLAAFVAGGAQPVWLIYVLAFVLACVDPLYFPAFQSILPSLVRPDQLPQANARIHIADNSVNTLGPVLAGALVLAFGYDVTVLINAGTFAVSALLVLFIRGVAAPVAARGRSVLTDIREGLRYIFKESPLVRATALVPMAGNFFVWMLLANVIFYLSSYRGFSPSQIGVVYAMQGVGAVAGAIIGARLLRRFEPGRVIPWAIAAGGLSMLLLIVARHPVAIGAAWMGQFGCAGVFIVANQTLRQLAIPDRLLGRVAATARMLAYATIPLASLATGALESTFHNAYLLFGICGGGWIVLGWLAGRSALRDPLPQSARA